MSNNLDLASASVRPEPSEVEAVYRITKRGAFVEPEPLLPAFDLADGTHDLYLAKTASAIGASGSVTLTRQQIDCLLRAAYPLATAFERAGALGAAIEGSGASLADATADWRTRALELESVLVGLSSSFGAGVPSAPLSPQAYDRRIREGIEITHAPMVEAWQRSLSEGKR